jgi:hypothetical protein
MECQGICKRYGYCSGEIRKVHVTKNELDGIKDWGNYYYCDVAIQSDLDNGFNIEDTL